MSKPEFTEEERVDMLRLLLTDKEKKAIRRALQLLSFSHFIRGVQYIGHDRDREARSTLLRMAAPI